MFFGRLLLQAAFFIVRFSGCNKRLAGCCTKNHLLMQVVGEIVCFLLGISIRYKLKEKTSIRLRVSRKAETKDKPL